jgi:hypothetical protein
MKKRVTLTLLMVAAVLTALGGPAYARAQEEEEQHSTRRFALVIGANNGGKGRVKLQYAVSDAKAIINVLETLGGVFPDDSRLLVEPGRDTLFWELNRLKDRLARAKKNHRRVEVLFYYSGHSDEKNILLGKDRVSYQEFRDAINEMPADVRIAILDSCASGAFTRLKGGKKRKPFLMDSAYDMKGYAVMTSSSSNEASQESERLKGSFFTHYLTSGLRGAADMTQDGRITLSEAYHFAFNETLAQTEKTVSGPQHPNYNISMSGTGDVIITDIRKSAALLRISKNVSGRLFIHDKEQVLVVELNKPAGRTVELALDKGKYRIINIVDGGLRESRIKLIEGKTVELTDSQFKSSKKLDAVARGDIKLRERYRVFKKRGRKLNFFAAFNSKFSRAYGKTAVIMGGKAGITFNKSLSIGFAGYGNSSDFPLGHPTWSGLIMEYALPSRSFFNLKIGALAGKGEEYLLLHDFFIFEPELSVTFNITRLLNVSTGLSYRYVSLKESSLAPLSWTFSFRFGK